MSSAKDNNIVDLLSFDVDGGLYLDINCKSINEFTAIYLIFLKYSSLSRYQPAEWFDKINSKELVIIEKILNDIFLKFWSKIAKELSPNRDVYLI
jgi:hypothetical protein